MTAIGKDMVAVRFAVGLICAATLVPAARAAEGDRAGQRGERASLRERAWQRVQKLPAVQRARQRRAMWREYTALSKTLATWSHRLNAAAARTFAEHAQSSWREVSAFRKALKAERATLGKARRERGKELAKADPWAKESGALRREVERLDSKLKRIDDVLAELGSWSTRSKAKGPSVAEGIDLALQLEREGIVATQVPDGLRRLAPTEDQRELLRSMNDLARVRNMDGLAMENRVIGGLSKYVTVPSLLGLSLWTAPESAGAAGLGLLMTATAAWAGSHLTRSADRTAPRIIETRADAVDSWRNDSDRLSALQRLGVSLEP